MQKPQDVSDPLVIDTPRHMEALALNLMGSHFTNFEYREMAYAFRPSEATERLGHEQKLLLFPPSEDLDPELDVQAVDVYQIFPAAKSSEKFRYCAVVCGSRLHCTTFSPDFETYPKHAQDSPRQRDSLWALRKQTYKIAKSKGFLFSTKDIRR